ncbi:MAG: GNAT family N-acetyltransferase [Lachnospiraceae bacterium]|nr:GNAT family N-acetyltransferase [Ruminococcus sp.]MCM1274014.1 GNAT family N-acetyltransferase [Lachnospiraceae bacterium]
MIRRALSSEELNALPKYGLEAQKIRALLLSYGLKYDFCRFFVGDFGAGRAFLGELNGSFVLSESGACDYEELAEFLAFSGFSELFCTESVGEPLSKLLPCRVQKVNVMRFEGAAVPCGTVKAPPLDDVYTILKTAFDIEYEPWYLDMSHRIRHGVSAFRMLDGSVLAIQHNINGEALLSQIATLPEKRRQGNARRLILSVCAELSGSDIYVICGDELSDFYRKLGFRRTGGACSLWRK